MRKEVEEQLSIFDILENPKPKLKNQVLNIGDTIGKVILGELRTAAVTVIEGYPLYTFYRTDSGCCYSYEDGLNDLEELRLIAEMERKKYKTIIPHNLVQRLTVEYPPHYADGKKRWAQIGIFEGRLFWKTEYSYQFLVPYENKKDMAKTYQKLEKEITEQKHEVVDTEHEMRRLYWSERHKIYADAEYVSFNG